MTDSMKSPGKTLENWAGLLVEDLIDGEGEESLDRDEEKPDLRELIGVIDNVLLEHSRKRLEAARAGLAEAQDSRKLRPMGRTDRGDDGLRLRELLDGEEDLTLAARSGKGIAPEDVSGLVEDLEDLDEDSQG